MPQMAPLNWLMLMIYFIMLFMLFNSMNYFSFMYKPYSIKMNLLNKNKLNWKW